MNPKLTIQEKLKDLRVERRLTLEQLAEETGISKSALGKYEADMKPMTTRTSALSASSAHRFRKLDMTIEKHRQTIIDTFVNAVFVHDDKILLTYNFKDGTRTITLSDIEAAATESGSDLEMFGAPKRSTPNRGASFWYQTVGLEPT